MTKKLVLVALAAVMIAGFAGCTPPQIPVSVDVTAAKATDGDGYDYAEFTFNFNQDVAVDSIHVMIPDVISPFNVQNVAADYEGDTDNIFKVYWLDGEDYIVPSGNWSVTIWGISQKTEEEFELTRSMTL